MGMPPILWRGNGLIRFPMNEDLLTFGLNRVPWLQNLLFGVPWWKYLASLIYILLAFYGARLLDWFVGQRLKRWAARTATNVDDLLIDLLRGPIKVVAFVILLHIGLKLFNWPAWAQDYLSKGLRLVVAWSITYVVIKGIDLVLGYWRKRPAAESDTLFTDHLFPVLRKSLKVFVVIVAVLLTSQNLGLNITSLLAGLSIGGLALGLAAQDTVANLFGAVAIFLDKPFRIGDRIKVEAVDGVVESIGLRSTSVRNLEGHLVTIPNKTMGNATITNVSSRPTIKTEMNYGLTYDTSPQQLRHALAILEAVYRPHPMTHDVLITFDRFADSALNLNVVHWWKGTDQRAYLAGIQELNLQVKEQFDAAGLNLAFPSQTLYLKQDATSRLESGAA